LLSSNTASAQSKCDAGRRKEYAKKVLCLAKIDAKADKTGTPVDTTKQQKCIDKFNEKCAKADAKGDCTGAVKNCAVLAGEADTCRDAAEADAPFCAEDGDVTACQQTSTLFNQACADCCDSLLSCGLTCFQAQSDACGSTSANIACAEAVNSLGCAGLCCL